MTAPPPTHPAILMDVIVEEFLIRLPPEDPAVLARAALINRQWYRVITNPIFRHRLREFHHSPPLLGYIANLHNSIRFVLMSSFRPVQAHRRNVRAVHSSHGRVLLHRCPMKDLNVFLSVWDPITDERRELPVVPLRPRPGPLRSNWDAAVICTVGDACNHMDFHFKVVFVGRNKGRDFSCLYSSEVDMWSDPIFVSGGRIGTGYFTTGTGVHIGSALYFMSGCNREIFKYDLLTNQMSTISLRVGPGVGRDGMSTVLFATEDGRLGVAKTSNTRLNSTLHLWLREHGRWEQRRPIELRTLLPDDALDDPLLFSLEDFVGRPLVAGFAKSRGDGVIFFKTRVGCFTVDLNSGKSKKIGECLGWNCIIPYVSFCTPAPGAVSTEERYQELVLWSLQMRGLELACQMNKNLKLQVQGLLNY